jgi:hypothetical protein
VAGARVLLPTVISKMAFLIGETRVGELQLTVSLLLIKELWKVEDGRDKALVSIYQNHT